MRRILSVLIVFAFITLAFLPAQEETPVDAKEKKLTLKEAIFTALKNNLNLQISMIDAENSQNAVKIFNGEFIPSLGIDFSTDENNTPSTGVLDGAAVVKNKNLRLNLTLSQKLTIGGTLNVQLSNSRRESNSTYSTVNPSLSSYLYFSLDQPLLKGFGTLAAKRNIYIALTDQKKSEALLKQEILERIYLVENAYWNLVYAYQNLDTMKVSLKRSQDLLKQNQIKVKVGAAARIDILDAEANVAADESYLLQAEQDIQNAGEELKRMLNMSAVGQAIIPTDRPEVKKIDLDFNAFLLEALENRPDIHQAKLDLKRYKIDVRYARNQMLPDLQLSASYYTTGTGGDQLITEGDIFSGDYKVIGVIKKDVWESMKDTFSNLYKNYSISLRLNVPLSFSREKAELARAKLQLKRAFLALKNTENTVYSDVNLAIRSIESNLKLVEAQEIRLDLENRKLKAEERKLSVGLSANYDVIQKQRDYVQAQTNHLNALRTYNMAIADLNRKLGRTFKAYDIRFNSFLKGN
jgi:outer membrane protein TolC